MSYVLNFVAHFPVLVFGTSVWERHLLTTVAGKGHANIFFFFFVFPTFHFRFPDFSLPFSRLFTSVFPTFVGFCKKKCFFIFSTFHFPDFFQVNIFFFIFPTFRFPDFSLPFPRLFTSVFPTFYFRFLDFLLPEVKSRENGSEKSGKRKKKHQQIFLSWKKSGK